MRFAAGARRAVRDALVMLAAVGGAAWPVAGAQTMPKLAVADTGARAAARPGDVLARRLSISLDDVPLEMALREIATRCELRLSYSSDLVPVDRHVSIARESASVGDVLRVLLWGTGIEPVVTPSGYVVLVKAPADRVATNFITYTLGPDGTLGRSVSRPALQPQLMDRVIVMGTPVGGAPERELASAVTVLTASQIAALGAPTMEDLMRTGVPGVVAWDLGISGPLAQIGSVRGSSSFTSNYLKTYVDGVELASPYMLFAIDPFSIERIEIIRGPQGSALYGSDAISGVVQIVTKRGIPGQQWHPHADALLTGGLMESRYVDGTSAVQHHSVMFSSGGATSSLGVGATYASSGAVVPGGSAGTRGTFGGFRHLAGPLRIEGTARYADIRFTAPENPLLRGQELPASIRPPVHDQHIENETYGLTLDIGHSPWWRHTLVLGLDRNAGAIPVQREPATVADALLGATRERASKSSVRFSSTLQLFHRYTRNDDERSGAVTVGLERSNLVRERLGLRFDVTGASDSLGALYHDDITNTGVFGQFKLDVTRALFITAGLRGEHNSTFGEHYGTAWSPMLGVAWTRDVGRVTTKFRLAYGKGIRPPAPSARQSISTVNYRQVANPLLEPESQSGVEGGIEVYAGDRMTVSLTGYSQHASGLIQEVILNNENSRAIQYQNVGRIANRGIELEGTFRRGPFRASLGAALTDSRVRALSSTYSGDLAVGDRVPEVPGASGSASLSWDVARSVITLGTSLVGSWTGYDWIGFISAQLDVTTAEPSLRDYLTRYPAVVKPFITVSRPFGRGLEWFGRVDNLTNVQRSERDNLMITAGRTMSIGLRVVR